MTIGKRQRANHRFEGTAEKLRFSVPRRLRRRAAPQAERYATKNRREKMKYLLIISHDDKFVPTDNLLNEISTWIKKSIKQKIRIDGNPLTPPSEAITIKVRSGKIIRSNGPFTNSKNQMCAYDLIECINIEEATQIAIQHPMAKVATIEVRPIWNELAN